MSNIFTNETRNEDHHKRFSVIRINQLPLRTSSILMFMECQDGCREEIRFMVEEHRNHYRIYRPHNVLAYLTPVEFAAKLWT